MKRRLLSVKELARELNVHIDTVRRAYRKREIPFEKFCKLYFFDPQKVRRAMRAKARSSRATRARGCRRQPAPPATRRSRPRLVRRGRNSQEEA